MYYIIIAILFIITNGDCGCNKPPMKIRTLTNNQPLNKQSLNNKYSSLKLNIKQEDSTFSLEALQQERKKHLEEIQNEQKTKETVYNLLGPQIYNMLYPEYIYCTDFTSEDSCLEIEGCSWCNWPNGHCQYTYTADLYPTQNYCIEGGYPLEILPAVMCGVPFSDAFTNCEMPAADAI
jgi:hypothetical protein